MIGNLPHSFHAIRPYTPTTLLLFLIMTLDTSSDIMAPFVSPALPDDTTAAHKLITDAVAHDPQLQGILEQLVADHGVDDTVREIRELLGHLPNLMTHNDTDYHWNKVPAAGNYLYDAYAESAAFAELSPNDQQFYLPKQ